MVFAYQLFMNIFHRLTMGKVEIGNLICLPRDISIFFLQKFPSLVLYVSNEFLNLIDCNGNKSQFQKNLFLKAMRGMKLELYRYVYSTNVYTLHKLCLLFFFTDLLSLLT